MICMEMDLNFLVIVINLNLVAVLTQLLQPQVPTNKVVQNVVKHSLAAVQTIRRLQEDQIWLAVLAIHSLTAAALIIKLLQAAKDILVVHVNIILMAVVKISIHQLEDQITMVVYAPECFTVVVLIE